MDKIVIDSLMELPFSIIKGFLPKIKDELTLEDRDSITGEKRIIQAYLEYSDRICVPRFYGLKYIRDFTSLLDGLVENRLVVPVSSFSFDYSKDKYETAALQNVIVEHIVKDFQNCKFFGGGLIVTPMGTGKTVIALKVVGKLQLRTLVIVHRKILLEQWVQKIMQFLNLKEEEIGIVNAEVCVYNKPIVIGMLQSILSKELQDDFKYNFGFVVVDEALHLAAPEWWKVVQKIAPKYILGLTGTPNKYGQIGKLLKMTIGTQVYGSDMPKVLGEVHKYSHTQHFVVPMFSRSNVLEDVFLWNCLVRKLVKNTEFNMGLVQLIKNYASLDGSKILVVTSRVEHAKMLYKVLVQYLPAKKIQLLIGGVRNAILDYDMYIGTDAYISEGIDIPSLNTLIITLPLQRNIKQLVGRLFRHISGKKITIVDFEWNSVPSISRLIENNRSRFQYYASLGCQIIDKEEVA